MANGRDPRSSKRKGSEIKDDHGFVVNPYVPKFISETPWYAEGATSKPDRDSDSRTFDEIHDRWQRYEPSSWKPPNKPQPRTSSTDLSTKDAESDDRRVCKNLRLREDVIQYLGPASDPPKPLTVADSDPFAWDPESRRKTIHRNTNSSHIELVTSPLKAEKGPPDRRKKY
jgi:hypothetical protein